MSVYGSNVDATIEIGAATGSSLPAFASDSYTEVPLTGKLKVPKKEISVAFYNVLNFGAKLSLGGKKADKTITGDIVIDRSETVHRMLEADADTAGGVRRNWKVNRPDGSGFYCVGFCNSFDEDEYDANSDVKQTQGAFAIAVDGDLQEF